jgi:hypothetical protein
MITHKLTTLPTGINERDTTYPKGTKDGYVADWDCRTFELFYTERFGWVIPCLLISRISRRQSHYGAQATDRSYAITINDQKLVSVGKGPHVKRSVTIHVRKSRAEALAKFLTLRTEGQAKAGAYRDTLSSRRMAGRVHRADDIFGALFGSR